MLVLDPVDAASAAAIVKQAKAKDVPVISYDRLINDADVDYYISFDNEKVGKLQAQSLVDKLKRTTSRGTIVMINGAPTDNNAKLFKKGAHSVLRQERPQDRQGVRHARLEPGQGAERDGAGDHSARQERLRRRLRRERRNRRRRHRRDEAAGVDPRPARSPARTQSSPAIQRILAGEQYMTIYKADQARGRAGRASWPWRCSQGKTPERPDHRPTTTARGRPVGHPRRRSP